ncbi:hypothetical protein DSM110093_03826 (plasmid) [Sulfitobacter sp. DSM 110093]|uniref:hypothetical protein n=1 Tax=Sulfitobacter sp. DSM 110093 TaxID=2883127 RepID=UPI001FAD9DFC|nr:hypothetical protein [Sulfitobacter sp. DSM 110093]UOA33730.1 hypothetical protein DSM110093_03565 [Sulfitobacter sp. DSM 110093]UOA33991.1 hypothetical protein DSM110093_03826 [Sulfitobacter sp. DSM 110093]
MSEVIKFPRHKTDETTRKRGDSGTYSLSSLVEGAMPLETFQDSPLLQLGSRQKRIAGRPPRNKDAAAGVASYDWSNQELATLFRINRLLNLADLTIATDRGVTDEGDPWFVFLDPKGEVFVHLCRIRAIYMLDSPSQSAVVKGHSLNDLVDAYIQQLGMAKENKSKARQNIIQLAEAKDRKVTVHPAAALAALIWTIYLQSDEASAAVTPEEDVVEEAAPEILAEPVFFDATVPEAITTFSLAEEATLLSAETHIGHDPDHAEKSVNLTLPANYVGMGLSALALTYGLDPFLGKVAQTAGLFSNGTSGEKDKISETDQKSLETMLLSISGADWNILQDFGENAEGIWSSLLDFDLFASSLVSSQVETIVSELMQAMEVTASLLTTEQLSKAPLLALAVGSEVFSNMRNKAYPFEDEGKGDSSEMALTKASQLKETAENDSVSMTDMPEIHVESSYVLANSLPSDVAAVLKEFGFSTTGNIITNATAQDYLSDFGQASATNDTGVIRPEGQLEKYDQSVRDFISFLMANAEDVQMISYETELVIIDEATLHQDSSLTYIKSWDLDDGGRISTIGLKADFEAFDLIA